MATVVRESLRTARALSPDRTDLGIHVQIRDEAHAWMMALLTSAHYGLPEYAALAAAPPPGGISALAALALTSVQDAGALAGLCPDGAILAYALIVAAEEPMRS